MKAALVGRCGKPAPTLPGADPDQRRVTCCALPHGHAGWHHDDHGAEWSASADAGSGDLDAAMWIVWQAGPWRTLTEDMSPAEREAAADAVLRHQVVLNRQGATARLLLPEDVAELRWWR